MSVSFIEEIVKRGSDKIIGFTFDLGEINDPKYGKANKLRGEFDIGLELGEFKFPAVFKDPQLLNKYALDVLPIARDVFPTCLDEEILQIVKDYGLFSSLQLPMDLSENVTKGLMLAVSAGWNLDDIGDDPTTSDNFMTYKTYNEIVSNMELTPEGDFMEGIPNVHPVVEGAKKVIKYALNLIQEGKSSGIPKCLLANGLIEDLLNSPQATFAIKEFKSQGQEISRKMQMEAFREINGARYVPYVSYYLSNIELEASVHRDYLFKTTFNLYLDLSTYYNAILGLKKDVRNKEEDTSCILLLVTKGNMNLQDAFDLVYKETTDAFKDYMIYSRKLLSVYENNENVKKFVKNLDHSFSGSLLAHKILTRYGIADCMHIKYSNA